MLSSRWKAFQVICLLQLVMAALLAASSFFYLFFTVRVFFYSFQITAFICILLFSNLATSILNNNYPDKPVSGRPKKQFNVLYMVNLFLAPFLGGHLINEVRDSIFLIQFIRGFWETLFLIFPSIYYLSMLTFQIIILIGMFRLRRLIYQNFQAEINNFTSSEA